MPIGHQNSWAELRSAYKEDAAAHRTAEGGAIIGGAVRVIRCEEINVAIRFHHSIGITHDEYVAAVRSLSETARRNVRGGRVNRSDLNGDGGWSYVTGCEEN